MQEIDVKPTAAAISDMAHTFHRYAHEMELIVQKMLETGDITYASQAATAVSNCMQNLRLDLLVTRPIRELMRERK